MATQGLPPIRKELLEEILRQLGIAQNTIRTCCATRPARTPRDGCSGSAPRSRARCTTFHQAAAQAMENAADNVWEAGIENAVESIGEIGLAPRIAQGPLLAIRSFLTSRIADISRAAAARSTPR
jgi:hypothetical protein